MKHSNGKILTTSTGGFYYNELPKDIKAKIDRLPKGFGAVEYEMANKKANIFFAKNFIEPNSMLSEIRGWFEGMGNEKTFIQPSKKQVRDAMLLSIDDGTYCLKSGGGTASDNCYSSSFKWMIADPKTGLDKDVVLIKKFSTKFEDVLITLKDFEELYELIKTDKDIDENQIDNAIILFSLVSNPTIKRFERFFINHKNSSMEQKMEMIHKLFTSMKLKNIEKSYHTTIERRTNEMNHLEKYGYEPFNRTQEEADKKRDKDVEQYRLEINNIVEYYGKLKSQL